MSEKTEIEMPESERPRRGQTRGSFFELNLAQCITVGTVVLGMLWAIFGYGRDLSDFGKAVAKAAVDMAEGFKQVNGRIDKLEEYVRTIDREGTQFGRNKLGNRTGEDEQTVGRIRRVEDAQDKVREELSAQKATLGKISTDMEWISGWVKAQAQQPAPDRHTK